MSRQELVNADSYSYTGYPPPPPYSSQGNYPTAPPKEEGGYASYPAPQYEQYPAQQPGMSIFLGTIWLEMEFRMFGFVLDAL